MLLSGLSTSHIISLILPKILEIATTKTPILQIRKLKLRVPLINVKHGISN